MKKSETEQRLKNAIRAFTVDAGTPEAPRPNGPAEAAFCRLGEALRALPDPAGRHIAALAAAFCDADADRLRELRQAADQFFREDFKRPQPFEPRLSLWARLEVWWSTAVLHRLECIGLREPTCYCYVGAFPGGDPRDFIPDPEMSTPEERERHLRASTAWSNADPRYEYPAPLRALATEAAAAWGRMGAGRFGLGTVLCEHHRREPSPTPALLRARRRVAMLLWESRRWLTRRCAWSRMAGENGDPHNPVHLEWCRLHRRHQGDHQPEPSRTFQTSVPKAGRAVTA